MYKLLPNQSQSQELDGHSHNSHRRPETAPAGDVLPPPEFLGEAIFAAGSFWGLEAAFGRAEGVLRTAAGYYGGTLAKPSYREVSEGRTGHTEAVRVIYDRRKLSYRSLCNIFLKSHDSTNKDYLKFGVGTHYRSAIFYRNEEERRQAQEAKVQRQMKLNRRIVTKIASASASASASTEFYLAENEHQKHYLQKRQIPLCESLHLRSTDHFVHSHLACKLNGILGGDENDGYENLKRFTESYQLPLQTRLVLEGILSDLSSKNV